ncbi:FERONIA [Hibiscus trionum]|uniref:FERONIA n=1 Tax=Hibiscus trionum TaxID=183268 RepID=A0A9W7LJ57_HIBTR|nr:FERONIA [Hibiscus trionum]
MEFISKNLLLPCLFFFFIGYLAVPVTSDTVVTPYNPIENIIIDCGSSIDGQSLDRRSWVGDVNGKFTPLEQLNNTNRSSTVATAAIQLQNSVDSVPYSTARLSRSEFTYSIPLTAGQKFIRFYFYPVSYPGFEDPSNKAFFSVKAGPYTLLKNFSALLHAQRQVTLVKEFCLNVDESQRLNLTFTPTPDISDSYAFINGIEVVSMRTNLYYTADSENGASFVGQAAGSLFTIGNNTALESVYRVNVGGQQISPGDDTGMFRSWSTDDASYLTIANPSALPVNTSINLTFSTSTPSFSAPREVYVTARTMGLNKTVNENYNLTWEFLVDSGFNYFVRLHFCEFQIEITEQGDRVFQIFLANLTAETQADVIVWSTGNGFPVFRDYVVAIGRRGNQKQQSLSVALHPTPAWRTRYSDAILNGLEIFKLSNNMDLAGPNPDPIIINPPGNSPPGSAKPNNSSTTIIGIVAGVIAGLVLLCLVCFLVFRQKRIIKDSGSKDGASRWSQFSHTIKSTKSTKSHGSSLPSDLCRYFTLAEIKGATNDFDNVFIIGVGGFGNVYKGFIDGGATPVAIKRLNPESQQGAHEFKTEIEMLSQLRHLHLVSLIGYCNDDGEMILIYDYMAHGTLRDHLYNTENPALPWKQRLQICIGAARGLQYLHSGAKHIIIHRDVKTTNILLDEKWVAKVSDFGLSRIGPTNMSKAHVSTVVKGSFGYLDPEYYRRQQLTEKSDVYSFGVVLCEILCARPPISRSADKAQISLAAWAQQCHRTGTLYKIIDPFLRGKIAAECLKKFVQLTMSCLHDEGTERPSMGDVVWALEFAVQLQESGETKLKPVIEFEGDSIETEFDGETPFKAFEDDSGDVFSSLGDHVLNSKSTSTFSLTTSDSFLSKDSEKLASKAVFSEIRDPQGR